jgi:integrase
MAIDSKDYPNKIEVGLYSNKKYDKFFYRFKVDGKSHRGIFDYSTKVGWDKKERVKTAKDDLSKTKKEAESSIDTNATVDEIINLYLDTLDAGDYKNSRFSYYTRKVKPIIGKKKAKNILPMHIQNIVNDNIKNGDSPRTAKQAVEILSPAFNIARANRIIDYNPCLDVKISIPNSKKIVVNATERLTSIYKAIMKLYKDDPYYRAFFLLALQGKRKGEVINLKWEYISFEYDYYVLDDTKPDEQQKVFLPPNVKEALSKFQQEKGWIFESPVNKGERLSDAKRQTAKLKKELGDWFTMHYMRNVMVSAMAERGVDAIHMSGALGHTDATTINKYLTINSMHGSKIASDMIQEED